MDTIQEQDLGARGPELLDRLSHGETFDIVRGGQTLGRLMLVAPTQAEAIRQARDVVQPQPASRAKTPAGLGFSMPSGRTFNDWLLDAPRLDDVLPPRDRSPMRDVDL